MATRKGKELKSGDMAPLRRAQSGRVTTARLAEVFGYQLGYWPVVRMAAELIPLADWGGPVSVRILSAGCILFTGPAPFHPLQPPLRVDQVLPISCGSTNSSTDHQTFHSASKQQNQPHPPPEPVQQQHQSTLFSTEPQPTWTKSSLCPERQRGEEAAAICSHHDGKFSRIWTKPRRDELW